MKRLRKIQKNQNFEKILKLFYTFLYNQIT